MKYQKPEIEIMSIDVEDIVRTSLTGEESGDNDGLGGDGKQPWE